MDEAAESVASLDHAGWFAHGTDILRGRLGGADSANGAAWCVFVVVDEHVERTLEVAPVHVVAVEAFGADGADEARR
jgi:hypothetical protein